jgi:hypothetical protein
LRIGALVLNVLFPFRYFFLAVESETATEINANTDQYNYIEGQGKRLNLCFQSVFILALSHTIQLSFIDS